MLSHGTEAEIAWRLDLGQSATEVAAACGVSERTVRRRDEQSGGSLDFPAWIVRQTRAMQDGWTEHDERDRRAQQPDWPEIPQVSDRLFEGPDSGTSDIFWASIWYATYG